MKNHLRTLAAASLLAASLVPCAAQAQAASYTIVDMGSLGLGSIFTYPTAINNAGQVVGQSFLAANADAGAFLYSNGVMTNIGTPTGMFSNAWAFGINGGGAIVGFMDRADVYGLPAMAYLYVNGSFTDLGDMGPITGSMFGVAQALGINDAGRVVGFSMATDGFDHAFIYMNGAMTDLASYFPGSANTVAMAINNVGQIAMWADNRIDACSGAFVLQNGTVSSIPRLGFCFESPTAINDRGQVVGLADMQFGMGHAFLYSGGVTTDLGTLPGAIGAGAFGINSSGVVVGVAALSRQIWNSRAFVYAGGSMTDLNTLLPTGSGWTLMGATAINDSGQIVGYGRRAVLVTGDPGEIRGFLMTPVSTPVQQISSLIAQVIGLNLPQGTQTSLLAKLNGALSAIQGSNPALACSLVAAFINEVQAQSGKKITVAQANALISSANAIRTAMGCGA